MTSQGADVVTVDDVRVFVRAYPQARGRCPPAIAAACIRELLDTVRRAGQPQPGKGCVGAGHACVRPWLCLACEYRGCTSPLRSLLPWLPRHCWLQDDGSIPHDDATALDKAAAALEELAGLPVGASRGQLPPAAAPAAAAAANGPAHVAAAAEQPAAAGKKEKQRKAGAAAEEEQPKKGKEEKKRKAEAAEAAAEEEQPKKEKEGRESKKKKRNAEDAAEAPAAAEAEGGKKKKKKKDK